MVGIAYEDILIRELSVPVLKGFARLALGSEYKLPTNKEALIHVVEGIANKKLKTSNTDFVSKYPAIEKAFSSEENAARAARAKQAFRSYMTYIPYAPKNAKNKLETSNTAPDNGPKYWLN